MAPHVTSMPINSVYWADGAAVALSVLLLLHQRAVVQSAHSNRLPVPRLCLRGWLLLLMLLMLLPLPLTATAAVLPGCVPLKSVHVPNDQRSGCLVSQPCDAVLGW